MNKKFNVGACVIASVLGFVAGGLISKTRIKRNNMKDVDKLAEEIDLFEEES